LSAEVTVIVTTRNSAKTLDSCLRSVRTQSVHDLELIVVDNFSSDETPSIGHRHADVFVQAGPERSRQRNVGAARASGSFLLFLDSDMVLKPPIVTECVAVADSGARAVIVPEVSAGHGYWAACKALERECYVGDDTIEAARFIDRGLFMEMVGFDEELTGEEDWDLTVRIRKFGAPIGRSQTALVHDEGRLTLMDTMRAKYYYGLTMPRYIRKHPDVARNQLKFFRPAFFRNFKVLARRPRLASGMFFMKGCEIVAGGMGAARGWWADRHKR
jgi:glycosyltransferase involved in cell wall biosynthesis